MRGFNQKEEKKRYFAGVKFGLEPAVPAPFESVAIKQVSGEDEWETHKWLCTALLHKPRHRWQRRHKLWHQIKQTPELPWGFWSSGGSRWRRRSSAAQWFRDLPICRVSVTVIDSNWHAHPLSLPPWVVLAIQWTTKGRATQERDWEEPVLSEVSTGRSEEELFQTENRGITFCYSQLLQWNRFLTVLTFMVNGQQEYKFLHFFFFYSSSAS